MKIGLLKIYFNTFHLRQNLKSLLLLSGFVTEMYAFLTPHIHATFPAHFAPLICSLIKSDEKHKL